MNKGINQLNFTREAITAYERFLAKDSILQI
jgi:hypothetical protein